MKLTCQQHSKFHHLVVYFNVVYLFVGYVCGHTVEVIGQLVGVRSLLPSPGSVLVAGDRTRGIGFVAGAFIALSLALSSVFVSSRNFSLQL